MAKAKDDSWGVWTAARVELLRQLWAEGIACAVIADEVGGGFDAQGVAGKARRLALGPHPSGPGGRKRQPADSHGEVSVNADSPVKPSASSNEKNDVSSNAASSNAVSSNRNARWRAKHPEQYRQIMRDYMRKWRAEKSASQSAGVTA